MDLMTELQRRAKQLEALGIQDGDTVSLYDLEFEYQR